MRRVKAIALLIALILTSFYLGGCNTFEGFGEDVSNLGEAIEDAAD